MRRAASPRYRAFIEGYRDKVRKKVRGASTPEAREGLAAELRAAALLLADPRLTLAYEAYGSGRGGPDFTLTHRGERATNLEVTRLHREASQSGIARVLLAKLRQLPAGAPNLLLLSVGDPTADGADLSGAAQALRDRADGKDEAFFVAAGFRGTRGFYDRFLRLGGVVAWSDGAGGAAGARLWTNRSARIAIPVATVRACLRCLRAGG
jgi:hypothetical protein